VWLTNQPKYKMQKVNNTDILVRSENSLYQREKSLRDSQTQKIYYSEEKASYKVVVLTYLSCSSCTINFDTYLYVNASQPDLLSEEFFNRLL